MKDQILPIGLAFGLGFSLGYVFRNQTSPKETSTIPEGTTFKALGAKFEKVDDIATARRHVGNYKAKHPHDEDPNYHTAYAVWSELAHVETHFEKKIKLSDLTNIWPIGATGIRVYEAFDDQGKAVNYLVFTNNSQTPPPYPVFNDNLDSVYLVKNIKIDLTKDKVRKPKKGHEVILTNHVVCNPRCPDESLL